jgi:hypothetical protein
MSDIITNCFLAVVVLINSSSMALASTTTSAEPLQLKDVTGKYRYKNYRKGKGGFENHLEITSAARGRLHLNFELTYFYMAGKDETFHEGSGEGDGQLNGNVLTATLSDGAGGSCRMTLTFNETVIANEVTVTVKSNSCQLNVEPDGLYRREADSTGSNAIGSSRQPGPRASAGLDVCPDPKSPCDSASRTFAHYELSFRLPTKLRKGKTYTSTPFYAALLRTYDDEACDADDHTAGIERERLRIQTGYPTRKVFAQYSCPNLDAIDYSFPGKQDATGETVLIMTFIAVYAGQTPTEANEFLTYVRTIFPQASLKRMTASYEIIDQ